MLKRLKMVDSLMDINNFLCIIDIFTRLIRNSQSKIIQTFFYRFFVFSVDYSRTEYLQFEDEDYYYYVKAVPKSTIAMADVRVQKINRVRRR